MESIAISVPEPLLPLNPIDSSGYTRKDYSLRGCAASAKLAKEHAKCEHCGGIYSTMGMPRHLFTCLQRLNQIPRKPNRRCHDKCRCGLVKASHCAQCFRCGEYDHSAFACLDLLIAARIETPREKLGKEGVPVDHPGRLAAWIAVQKAGHECT